jgi:hypothetical protein
MSMSQEEIEALMNGIELTDEESSNSEQKSEEKPQDEPVNENANEKMSEDDIESLLSQVDGVEEETSEEKPTVEEKPTEKKSESLDETPEAQATAATSNSGDVKEDISEVLNEIDNMQEDAIENSDEIIEQQEDAPLEEDDLTPIKSNDEDEEYDEEFNEKAKNWTEKKIVKGEFPFPADRNTRVVSQLHEVANDSEEKAGKIFDVLSYVLDDNADIQKSLKSMNEFIDKEVELLNSLSNKFPNISVFKERLEAADEFKKTTADIGKRLNDEDMKLFEAMELMQFHDINRQKIERVMSIIRKLTTYLNNLFEEDEGYEEIAIAKHIHGDDASDLVSGEDMDALIAEFSK